MANNTNAHSCGYCLDVIGASFIACSDGIFYNNSYLNNYRYALSQINWEISPEPGSDLEISPILPLCQHCSRELNAAMDAKVYKTDRDDLCRPCRDKYNRLPAPPF